MKAKSGVVCSTVPVMMSPMRCENSSKICWRAELRTMSMISLLACWAAMREASLGVTSSSSNSVYSPVSSSIESSRGMSL